MAGIRGLRKPSGQSLHFKELKSVPSSVGSTHRLHLQTNLQFFQSASCLRGWQSMEDM